MINEIEIIISYIIFLYYDNFQWKKEVNKIKIKLFYLYKIDFNKINFMFITFINYLFPP